MRKKKCFISHCSSDEQIMEAFSELMQSVFSHNDKSVEIFNTFTEKSGTDIGEGLSEALKKNIAASDLMIAIITDNYIRSIKCLAELSSFWYLSRKVLPIVFNGQEGVDYLYKLFGEEIIYLDPQSLSPAECAIKLLRTLQNSKFHICVSEEDFCRKAGAFFQTAHQQPSRRPYIGSGTDYDNIMRYCQENGIDQITDEPMNLPAIIEQLKKYKDVYIVSTTGANLISGLSTSYLTEMLLAGNNFTLLLPNKYSAFCRDVAQIEAQDDWEGNYRRLANAFDDIMTNLQRCVDMAQTKSRGEPIGRLQVGCTHTLLRQTITFAKSENACWGWLSMTMPPSRTNHKTPSFSFSGPLQEDGFGNTVWHHISGIYRIAKERGNIFELRPGKEKLHYFYPENEAASQYWEQQQNIALQTMMAHRFGGNGVLIEVAANHPLREGKYPGTEFSLRLDFAWRLYQDLKQRNQRTKIYIPGSRHRYGEHTDCVSLSRAGTEYLSQKGVPPSDLLGEEQNRKYKGKEGVYNSADECFVAAKIFDEENYQDLLCVCSPNQIERKKLFYLAFGVQPQFYTVPCESLAHNTVYELMQAVPDVLYHDHTWQGPDSKNGMRTREERYCSDESSTED